MKDMETIESHIDQYLLDKYMGSTIEVVLPIRMTERMAQRLSKKYFDAGWKTNTFNTHKQTATLSEQTCSGGAYYDR
jgi:hypothetical protein